MTRLLADLIFASAERAAEAPAVSYRDETVSYGALAEAVEGWASALIGLGLGRRERVAVYLEKRIETVVALFGAAAAGTVFVPVNPLLRPHQAAYILRDCDVRVLVTSRARLETLVEALGDCPALRTVVVVDGKGEEGAGPCPVLPWSGLLGAGTRRPPHRAIDADMAAILYTSGSTGMPKGVVLSHRNMVAGALSVSGYLENAPDDRILAALPFSFDAGLSQATTAFAVGAQVVLMNYLVPRDVLKAVVRHRVTGLTCVPPLWIQLAQLDWPEPARESLRYIANTGGAMPRATLARLRAALPETRVYLMYGLTEAFRSTYLPPSEVDRRPESIGKAIPGAEILVVDEAGKRCPPGQVGELVHRGALVAMGYWNDPERTAERFRPAPLQPEGVPVAEIAVWSGDQVRSDEDGFLYFVGRRDEMIKTSGYRVSPTEVEEAIYDSGLAGEVAALGVPHPVLGQAVVVVATPTATGRLDAEAIVAECRRQLPPYMVPHRVIEREALPRNANGKIDRKGLAGALGTLFVEAAE